MGAEDEWMYKANPNPQEGHRLCIAWEGGDPDEPEEDWYEAVILKVKDKGNSRHKIKYKADGTEEWVDATEEFASSSKYNPRRLRWHKDTFSKNNKYTVPTTSKALKTPDSKQPRASSPVGWSSKKAVPGATGGEEEESSEQESSENKVFAFAHQKYAGKVEPKEQDNEVKDQLPEAFNSIADLLSVMEEQEITKVEKTTDTTPGGLAKEKQSEEKEKVPEDAKAKGNDAKSEQKETQPAMKSPGQDSAPSAKPALDEETAEKKEEMNEKEEKESNKRGRGKGKKAETKPPQKKQKAKEAKESDEAAGEYIVESIVEMRMQRGKPYFLVKWLGYASAENTWEPYENVELCEMLASFGKSNPKDKEALDDFLAKKSGGGKRKA